MWDKLKTKLLRSKLLTCTWAFIYRRWLDEGDTVVRVVGWRTALIQSKWRSRRCTTVCFGPFQ